MQACRVGGWAADLRKGHTKGRDGHYLEQLHKGLQEESVHSHGYCIGERKDDSNGTAKLCIQVVQGKEVDATLEEKKEESVCGLSNS